MDKRTPRGHSQAAVGPEVEDAPPVTAVLVEHLAQWFPLQPSPVSKGLGGAIDAAIDQAEQRGRQQVIEYLRALSNSPNS